MADDRVVGKIGQVTGRIGPARLGEVMIEIRGGTEAYHAYAADPEDEIPPGAVIIVVDHAPPRTVTVTRM
jgi:hypothetical protein